jgi:hypothetical protein
MTASELIFDLVHRSAPRPTVPILTEFWLRAKVCNKTRYFISPF